MKGTSGMEHFKHPDFPATINAEPFRYNTRQSYIAVARGSELNHKNSNTSPAKQSVLRKGDGAVAGAQVPHAMSNPGPTLGAFISLDWFRIPGIPFVLPLHVRTVHFQGGKTIEIRKKRKTNVFCWDYAYCQKNSLDESTSKSSNLSDTPLPKQEVS